MSPPAPRSAPGHTRSISCFAWPAAAVPVNDRPKPLLVAVRIVAGHRVLRGRGATTLAHACLAGNASAAAPASTGAGQTGASPRVNAQHGISPSSAPTAIGRAARHAGETVATAVKTSGQAALRHLLLVLPISFVVIGGWVVIFPLARFIRPARHS